MAEDDEAKRRGTQKSILERKAYPSFEIIIEINNQNSWTIHEDVTNSVDLFLRGHSGFAQIRNFYLTDKIKITCQTSQNFLTNTSSNLTNLFSISTQNWVNINQSNNLKSLALYQQKLIIYPYSLSNNLLKEVLLRRRFKFVLTNEIKKANLIIGLKKHLKQNFKLITLAKQKNIPIYGLNQISFYQITKFVQFLSF